MVRTIVSHKVESYMRWKSAFEKFIEQRRNAGERSYIVGRSTDDPNMVYVINEWDDAKAAQSFLNSSDLADTMKNSGLLGPPTVVILDQDTSGKL